MTRNVPKSKKTGIVVFSSLFAFLIFAVSVSSYFVLANEADDFSDIKQVHLIFRHGSKFPDAGKLFGIEPAEPPPLPLGSLTLKGMNQMYQLGKLLRRRYKHLQSRNGLVTRSAISAKSSISDRAISSALSFLASFMPPEKAFSPFDDLMWQPVPVISIPREHDTLIIQRRNCPRYDVEMKRQLQSEAIRTYEESNLELYEFLTSKSGVNISTFAGVDFLHNSLVAMETAGWKLPEWTREVYPKKTFAICLRYLKFLTETKFMKLTRGGPLLTEIANSMSSKSDKIVGLISPNISIYSGHDVTLVNLMSVLNVANQLEQEPKYAATLAVELYGGSDDDVNVRVLYFLDETDANPRELTMPDCASPCNLRRFMEVNQEYFVTDYDKMCREVESQG